MGISIQIQDAEFTNVISSLSLPDREGLIAEYTFGESDAKSLPNRASPGAIALTKVGAPAYGDNYAEITAGGTYGSNGFDTGIKSPDNATIITVVKKDVSLPPFISTNANFAGFHNYQATVNLYNSQSGTTANVADVPIPAHTDFAFFCGLLPLGGFGKIYAYTGGALTTATAETASVSARSKVENFKIGTSLVNAGSGRAKVAYTAIFDRLLSDAEIAAAYASLKAYMTTRGVVVS